MPKFLEILIQSILPKEDYFEKAGDIEEVYLSIIAEKGRVNANTWIIIQIILALPSFIINRIYWGNTMFRNYLTITGRIIKKYKSFSAINIFGLGTGLAVFILIGLFVKNEFEYEHHHKNLDNIYRINIKYEGSTNNNVVSFSPVPMAKVLENNIPEIINSVRFCRLGEVLFKKDNVSFNEMNYSFVDKSIFDVFTIELLSKLEGNPLERLNTVVLSEAMAKKYFGGNNPIGEYLEFDNERKFEVTGIMKKLPTNSFIQAEILMSMQTLRNIVGEKLFNNKISTVLAGYIQIADGADINFVQDKSIKYLEKNYFDKSSGKESILLEPLKDIHLYSEVAATGDINIVLIFIIAAFLILLIACINFMNLSTAKSLTRAKEIGIRKSNGASRIELIKQFLGESFIFSFLSLLLAIVLIAILLPSYNELTSLNLTLVNLLDADVIIAISVIWILTSVAAGSYPALYLSKFDPVDIMNGKVDSGTAALTFRRTLVIVQFSIAISLIASTFIINDQLDFMINKNLGFDSDKMLIVKLQGDKFRKKPYPFKNEILKNPNVINVALSDRLPSSIGAYNIVTWEGAAPDQSTSIIQTRIEPDFIKTYGINVLEGPKEIELNSPELKDGIFINEQAVKRFGWTDGSVGKKITLLYGNKRIDYKVLGVIQNFHFSSLRNEISPLKLMFKENLFRFASVKLKTGNIDESIKFIENKWMEFNPEYPFEYYFMDEVFERRYRAESNLKEIFTYFSIITLIVSCLGLLGLASFLAVQKTKEIGIRKVLGATSGMIIHLLSKDFMKYVIISNLIAWPIAYIFMQSWLEEFAYKTSINPIIIVAAGLIALFTAFGAVGYQAVKASNANPVNSLRNE